MDGSSLPRVLEIASEHTGIQRALPEMAIDQDMGMSGDDVTDFAEALAKEFGETVWSWPWQRFAVLDEGLSLFFPFMLVWQLVSWPFRGSFEYPSPHERLTLLHISEVINRGAWFEPS